jgi:alkylation response protein AidB-like acyl-CoA dehydrogenase
MELMGAYGYGFDYHAEKYLRDVKIAQLWLGGPLFRGRLIESWI